ncbi:unnamed protein product [Rotaria sordida]|uniref:ABC transporter domain-containing protein n=1 Tax=Rotaria sordida TaxID=392033 RepID=A0A814CJS4_9BILA|nr:unnamed protein product [Rotaria sordida]
MSNRQPLLSASNKSSISDDDENNGNKKQLSINRFLDWHRYFSTKKKDKYIELDDDTEYSDKDTAIDAFHFFRLPHNIDVKRLLTLTTPISSLHQEVMTVVHRLLIIGVARWLCCLIQHFIWNITVKRQIFHMNAALFRSLIQRSIPYMDTKPASQFHTKLFDFIVPSVQSFSEARGAAATVFRLIDEGNDSNVNEIDVWKEDTEPIYDINGDIEFNNVNFTYRSREDTPALHNLSIIAHAGQTTALVGSSGSGKSTCISLFLRYYEPSSGQIMINGRPITDYCVKQLRQNIGIVSQEPILFSMSIYENIRLGKVDATQAEIEQAAQEANAHNFIMQLPNKYETFVGERGIQLSGGEKQRIALARALVKQPTFLLLDEATSALDNISEKIVQEALDRTCKGRTTIVIAHRLTTIQNAHQIYVLDNGTVIEQGTHEILIAKEGGKYQSMVKHQQMERINDDEDTMMLSQKDTEDYNKSIIEQTRLLSNSPTVDVNKLAGEVIHNMRTIKQLSVEKEVLRQYSELIHPTLMSSRIASSISSVEAFFDLFDRIPSIDNTSTEGQELVDFHGEITFDQVKFIYPTRSTSIILNKFQLNIKPTQCVALVGASGCGKSTIIQLLERFYDVTSGQILLDGIDIRKLNLNSVRSHFGLVSQEPILFDLTIAENIAYALENISMEDIINAARRANIHQFIEQLPQGYETKVGLKGSFLSGGEKQRIAIARILLRRPKVLLLDEATSAMDSYNEQIVQGALEQAQTEDSSRTSLIVAHRLSTIRSCDLICVLDRGHIVESGTHEELIQRHGAYYDMLVQNNLQ